ncbi:hypothetical protein Q4577_16850 [Marinovum sp. 2_MG-2023]|uniref:hypothetical protein n=1 Tax=Roseobacteraceae TaxID=2854170 RepID=UPI001FD0D256|nr:MULTISPECIES: hypothetical protein [Roseobacteraceae]MCJ7872992.1 hypothetical protein [Phaeobacter sp. J2-8]MDO6731703.1 hypothetical protein [Marinovum sp. 2_MG-2023]MDO6780955.1 hypothetical protein [Marinovum sp. 1_MG-2023]
MSETLFHFDKRVRRIAKKNRKLARGHTNFIDGTGVIRQRPTRKLTALPIRGLMIIAFCFFAFKGLLIAHQGVVQYEDRLDLLAAGSIFEQGAAWVMQVDPVAMWFAGLLSAIV